MISFSFSQSYSERHVSFGSFGEQLLDIEHKIMSIATSDVVFRNATSGISSMYASVKNCQMMIQKAPLNGIKRKKDSN